MLDATRKIIWKNGINNTSVDQICEEAGLSKMTFYRAYENKFDIIKEILDENYEKVGKIYDEIFNKNIPFIEKIMEIIYYNTESVKEISPDLIRDIVKQDNPQMKEYSNVFYSCDIPVE